MFIHIYTQILLQIIFSLANSPNFVYFLKKKNICSTGIPIPHELLSFLSFVWYSILEFHSDVNLFLYEYWNCTATLAVFVYTLSLLIRYIWEYCCILAELHCHLRWMVTQFVSQAQSVDMKKHQSQLGMFSRQKWIDKRFSKGHSSYFLFEWEYAFLIKKKG